jgi:hypothetical protein
MDAMQSNSPAAEIESASGRAVNLRVGRVNELFVPDGFRVHLLQPHSLSATQS